MIPKKAKRVFTGVMFDVYQWKEKMFDGTYGVFEGIKRKPSVQLIVISGDKIILQKEEQPHVGKFISVPGGIINRGESPLSAAKRELLEETGMKAEKIIFWRKAEFSKKIEWDTHYFIARGCKKVSAPHLDNGEKISSFPVSFNEFVKIVSEEGFRNKELSNYVFRLKQDKKALQKFKKEIFGLI